MTGAGGEGMVLSGPEAAALLAQLGIELGAQDQVIIGGDGEGDAAAILEQLQMQVAYFVFRSKINAEKSLFITENCNAFF